MSTPMGPREVDDPRWIRSVASWLDRMAPSDATPRVSALLLIFAGGLSAALFAVFALAQISFGGDVAIYHQAVRTALSGIDVYSRTYSENGLPFAYPPTALVPLLFTALPLPVAITAMWLMSTLALLISIRALMWPERTLCRPSPLDGQSALVTVMVLITFPVIQNLELGQINLVLCALIIVDALGLTRSRFGGALIGLAACVKLTPALFIVWLWLIGRRRAALTAVAVMVAGLVVSALAMPASLAGYMSAGARDALVKNAPIGLTTNQSFAAIVARSGNDSRALDALALIAGAAVAIVGLIVAVRLARRGHLAVATALLGVASVSVAPIAWIHHFVWLPLLAVALWSHADRIPRARPVAAGLYLVALFPPAGIAGSGRGPVTLVLASSYVLIAAAVCLWLLVVTRTSRSATA